MGLLFLTKPAPCKDFWDAGPSKWVGLVFKFLCDLVQCDSLGISFVGSNSDLIKSLSDSRDEEHYDSDSCFCDDIQSVISK